MEDTTNCLYSSISDNLSPKICYTCRKKGHTKYSCKRHSSLGLSMVRNTPEESDVSNQMVITGVNLRDRVNPLELFNSILTKVKLKHVNHTDVHFKSRSFNKRLHRSDEILLIFHKISIRKKLLEGLREAGYNNRRPESTIFEIPIEVQVQKKSYQITIRHNISSEVSKFYNETLRLEAKYGTLHLSFGVESVVVRKYSYIMLISNDKTLSQLKELLERKGKKKVEKERIRMKFLVK